ncbi:MULTISPECIES: SDR family NAD(P)-dependent oxidoreductase [unclassified Pseudonocardia]|uniref:SDR family NAD(P)-dependent oxidoreductase n=1 Tax=unclassified Pseudonocardia TaxID=2619320 RepID=UPI00094B0D19|nr:MULTISPECIES: SDR family NAD(P)-dependent oxidoreductase [unclassified Pseudonocardia]OLM12536.1 3-oxoacyl-[acyl-carrier protein] reductase [Pseudonocardia sp. Ae505_Ps2]OLM29856.1 3-oxoacyl-[acyl-carrier protein] reductase [Pseudonocardia sp. Ae717_Ps2]
MTNNRTALVTGANQGMGKHVATGLVADGYTVYIGSRDLGRGEIAAKEIGEGAVAVQLEVTDTESVAAAARRIREEVGSLNVLVNNAAISTTRPGRGDLESSRAASMASVVPLDEVRGVWEVNVIGALAVYQAMVPLLQAATDARVVNVTSALGSLTLAENPELDLRANFSTSYAASKSALNAVTLAMMIESETTGIKVNLVSPGFANTQLVNFQGTDTIEDAAREILRVARLGPDGAHGTFTTWENLALPW